MRRLSVGHPVVNDRDHRVWREYAVSCWPTLMLVDPRGKLIGVHEGEFALEDMDAALARLIAESDRAGKLDRRPLSFTAARENEPDRPLFFPGKVLADAAGQRLFVADTGHHRVLELSVDGRVRRSLRRRGGGLRGRRPQSARFRGPQGMALAGEWLYVADTDNHAIRRIDLQNAPGRHGGRHRGAGATAPTAAARPGRCRSARRGTWLRTAAGSTWRWPACIRYGKSSRSTGPCRGSAAGENIVDGPAEEAQLAQPSGLAIEPRRRDAVRRRQRGRAAFAPSPWKGATSTPSSAPGCSTSATWTAVGDAVRLQHPLGLAFADGVLYVADSYNHKIKRCDPAARRVTGFLGSGVPGHRDGPAGEAQFSEPGGVSYADGKLYVADTNNHAIRVCDVAKGKVRTLEVRN